MTDRERVISVAKSYLGTRQGDSRHKEILDIYNAQRPLPVGYKVKPNDSWCATFVTVVFIKAGLKDLIPPECSCPRMVALAQKMQIWNENDAYKPHSGDIIMYAWKDDGVGDNRRIPDHVGIVWYVKDGYIYVIEGNKNRSVAVRKIPLNGRFIRGFIVPKFNDGWEVKPIFNQGGEEKVKDNTPSPWAKEFWKEATEKGLVDGTRPRDNITREEAVVIALRILNLTELKK